MPCRRCRPGSEAHLVPTVTARRSAEGSDEDVGAAIGFEAAGVGAEVEKDGTAETEERTADVGTGAAVTDLLLLLLGLVFFPRHTTTIAVCGAEGGFTCTAARTHAHRHGIEIWSGIGTGIDSRTGTGIDIRKGTRPLLPTGTTTTLGRTVIAAVTVPAGGAGVAMVVRGGVRTVVAVLGSRSNTWRVVALATAMAPAAMVKGEANGREA